MMMTMTTTTTTRRRRRRMMMMNDDHDDDDDDDDDEYERTLDECEKGKRKRRLMRKEVGKSSFNPSALRDYKTWRYPDIASQ